MIKPSHPDFLQSSFKTLQTKLNTKGEKQSSSILQSSDSETFPIPLPEVKDIVDISPESLKINLADASRSAESETDPEYKKVYVPDLFPNGKVPTITDYLNTAMPGVTPEGVDNSPKELPSIIKLPADYDNNPKNDLPGATIGIKGNKATVILEVNFESQRAKELKEKRKIEKKRLLKEQQRKLRSKSARAQYQTKSVVHSNGNAETITTSTQSVTETVVEKKIYGIIQKPANGSGPAKIKSTYTVEHKTEIVKPVKITDVKVENTLLSVPELAKKLGISEQAAAEKIHGIQNEIPINKNDPEKNISTDTPDNVSE